MTEYSRPWGGTTLTDSGPYEAEEWNDVWGALMRSGVDFGRSADYNIGVFYALGNHLEAAVNGTNIDVDTGGGLVDGLYHENDATKSIDIGSVAARPAANPRIDYIVVRKNYSNVATYTPANSTATVPPETARITVIRGTEAAVPVAPSLTQDTTRTTYWDIPIATVQVSVAGALSNFTDVREFVDAETKYVFVQGARTKNNTIGGDLAYNEQGWEQPDNNKSLIAATWRCPSDFISDAVVSQLVMPVASGNYYGQLNCGYGADGQNYNASTDTTGFSAIAVTGPFQQNVILATSLTSFTLGDFLTIWSERDATDVLDTINSISYSPGFEISYFGWKK